MIPLGYRSIMAQADALRRWALPAAEYEDWRRRHDARPPVVPMIDAIEIDPVPGLDGRRLVAAGAQPARPPRRRDPRPGPQAHLRARPLRDRHLFDRAHGSGRRVLQIAARPKPWGPTYARAGLELSTDLEGMSTSGVVLLLDATELNSLGGTLEDDDSLGSPLELRTRFFQPLTHSGALFVSPRFEGTQVMRDVFADGVAVGSYRVSRAMGGLDLGADFGTWAELRVGYEGGYGKGRRRVGDPAFSDVDFDLGAIAADLAVDHLDDANLPHSGIFANVHFAGPTGITRRQPLLRPARCEDRPAPRHRGRWTATLQLAGGDGFGTPIPFYDEFWLGGPLRLSGRPQGQITGDTYGLAGRSSCIGA